MLAQLLAAISVGATVYFIIGWYSTRKMLRTMTHIERANAVIAEAKRREQSPGLRGWVARQLRTHGYNGDLTPALLAITVGYLGLAVVLQIFGMTGLVGLGVALVTTVFTVLWVLERQTLRRVRMFNRQLLQMLDLLIPQLAQGTGPHRALEKVVSNLQDPLRSEFQLALDASVASKSLVTALQELQERYPSKAFRLFLAALEVDELRGGRLEPALQEAATSLRRDYELSEEALAEVSEARLELFGIIGVIVFIAITMIFSGGPSATNAYTSTLGIIVLGVTGINFIIGVRSSFKLLARARGNV